MAKAPNLSGMRMAKEMLDLTKSPPHGITCWAKNDQNNQLEAIIQGSPGTPYQNGSFHIDIEIPDKYPMDPPQLKFITKIYHPNIDNSNGLICLDLLKKPPHGKWTPVINLSSLLTSIQQLLSDPNPHDPLDAAIAQEYITNHSLFVKNATSWTQQFAMENTTARQSKRKSSQMDWDQESESVKRSRSALREESK